MITYFDTSAIIPLVVEEPGSERALSLWNSADRVVVARLAYPEGRAALAQARRAGRMTARQMAHAVRQFDGLFERVTVVEIDQALARRAGELAEAHALRGYDAVHLAALDRVRAPELVAVAGDGALLRAAHAEGIATAHVG